MKTNACSLLSEFVYGIQMVLRQQQTYIYPPPAPDLDALPPPHIHHPLASCGRALPLERSAAMGVKLSASEASRPIWAKTPQGATPRTRCSHFRYTWRLKKKRRKKKSNVCAIFSNDQSHLPEIACEVVFHPAFFSFFPFYRLHYRSSKMKMSLSNPCPDVRCLIVHAIA